MKYKKKPVVIEAHILGQPNEPDWLLRARGAQEVVPSATDPEKVLVKTLEGTMAASLGDYIIKGVRGELYFCKADIFLETYELAE